jgi:hypothetical protein
MINLLKSLGYKNIEYKVQDDGEHSEWFWRREFTDAYRWLNFNKKNGNNTNKKVIKFYKFIHEIDFADCFNK